MISQKNICVSIGNCTFDECRKIVQKHLFIELRIDLLDLSNAEISLLFKEVEISIATCRKSTYSKQERILYYKLAIDSGASFIDLDIEEDEDIFSEIQKISENKKVRFITSYHDQLQTPPETKLIELIEKCKTKQADIIKIVGFANSHDDVTRMIKLNKQHNNIVAFTMGNIGRYSRLTAPISGAPFTYAQALKDKQTAVGQYSFSEMVYFYTSLGLYQEAL